MSPETWNRVAEIAGQALELPPAEREAFARAESGDNQEVLAAVLDMLRANEEMGDFLDAPPSPETFAEDFGPYRAVREIGHGGMSLVYLGERIEKDFSQRVAIKVILHKSPGVLQESETRILSRLEHPNIARFLDAGITHSGLPYLVMEYVDGVPCTEYCRTLPDEKSKLRVFLQICAGVQYANRSLIVHRDLKPGNVLVDQSGSVKLLDFGIAKILSPDQSATVGTRAYTPDYASPEQILGNPITTATDVYSLGVLLCEMVGSKRPRAMLELPMPELVKSAQTEISEVPFQGDLEIIARKALRCDPAQRYESAADMARDIERYLDGKPIEARPASWRYRATRFIQRNRYAVAAGSAAVLLIGLAGGTALWQARIAAKRFDQVRSLASSVLFELYDSIEKLPGSLKARQLLGERSLQYLDALASDSTANADLQVEVAKGFARLGDIEGSYNLGNSKSAMKHYDKSLAVMRRIFAREPSNLAVRLQFYRSLDFAAAGYDSQGNSGMAISLAEEGKRVAFETLQQNPRDQQVKRDYARSQYGVGFTYNKSKAHKDKSLAEVEASATTWKEILDSLPDDQEALEQLSACKRTIGTLWYEQRKYTESRIHYTEAYELDKKLAARVAGKEERVAFDLGQVAVTWAAEGKHAQAIGMYQEQLRVRRELLARDPASLDSLRRVGVSINRICDNYVKMKDADNAIKYGEEAVAIQRKVYAKDPTSLLVNREYLYALVDLGHSYGIRKQKEKYCPLVWEAEPLLHGPLSKIAVTFGDQNRMDDVTKTLPRCPK